MTKLSLRCVSNLHRDFKWASVKTKEMKAGDINLDVTDSWIYLKTWIIMRFPRIVSQTAFFFFFYL